MAIYKYMSAKAGLRYLDSWHLRLSPATALNDPFEFQVVVSESHEAAIKAQSEVLYERLDREAGRTKEERLAQWERSWAESGLRAVSLTEAVREAFIVSEGVLCLTRTQRHLLMWAHYADGHRGMLLEFDEKHPCFQRSIPNTTFLGRLISVTYSDSRHLIREHSAADTLAALATKALEWSYEQEVRLFLPLAAADKTVDDNGTPIHLLQVPASALKTITLGCLFGDHADLSRKLRGVADHVTIKKSRLDAQEFRLHYDVLSSAAPKG